MADQEPRDLDIRPFTREEVAGKTLQEIVEAMQPNPYTLVGDPMTPNQKPREWTPDYLEIAWGQHSTQRLTQYMTTIQPSIVKALLDGFREQGRGDIAATVNRAMARELYQQRIPMRYDHPQPTLLEIVNPAPMLLDPMTNNDPRFAVEIEDVPAAVKPGPYDVEVSE